MDTFLSAVKNALYSAVHVRQNPNQTPASGLDFLRRVWFSFDENLLRIDETPSQRHLLSLKKFPCVQGPLRRIDVLFSSREDVLQVNDFFFVDMR